MTIRGDLRAWDTHRALVRAGQASGGGGQGVRGQSSPQGGQGRQLGNEATRNPGVVSGPLEARVLSCLNLLNT